MSYWQNIDTDDTTVSGAASLLRRGRLGSKLIVQILMLNALLSLFASSIQLYASYQRDRSLVLGTVSVIDESFRSGFQDALWEYNFPLVEALLDGVYSKPDVRHLSLTTEQGRSWTLGEPSATEELSEVLTFNHTNGEGKEIWVGDLKVGLTFDQINARAWSQFWTLLFSNFTKTVIASFLMLVLFEHNVGRHLSRIASVVSNSNWSDSRAPVSLERAETTVPDDLDHIVEAINSARQQSFQTMDELTQEIDRHKRTEDVLRERSAALENANREQAQFTYAISHDLKSPANTITMLLQELELNEGENLSQDSQEMLRDARNTVHRMTRLVEDVLGYARTIEEGMKTELVDLNAVVKEIISDLRGDIKRTNAQITTTELPSIQGNRGQLRMLLQNLISNAIKFRDPDRPPEVKIAALPSKHSNRARITVADNGIGIAPEFHEKVFELFQRLHSYGKYDGSGLGLTLCKRIVINHTGRIRLSSTEGEGTTFEITLPREIHGK